MHDLDSPDRILEIKRTIEIKPSLKRYYKKVYGNYVECLQRCPRDGYVLELGSGAGFAKQYIPELITSDILPYDGVDRVVDATDLPFSDGSLKMICMMNVLHHINNVELFFKESQRCLAPGGRLFMVDHHIGYISRFVIKYLHHEPFRPDSVEWKFESEGPLSSANTALPWMVFMRDIKQFEYLFPRLRLVCYTPHSPLWYWLSGGLKKWNLLPVWMFGVAAFVDGTLLRISPRFGSFVNIEIVRE